MLLRGRREFDDDIIRPYQAFSKGCETMTALALNVFLHVISTCLICSVLTEMRRAP